MWDKASGLDLTFKRPQFDTTSESPTQNRPREAAHLYCLGISWIIESIWFSNMFYCWLEKAIHHHHHNHSSSSSPSSSLSSSSFIIIIIIHHHHHHSSSSSSSFFIILTIIKSKWIGRSDLFIHSTISKESHSLKNAKKQQRREVLNRTKHEARWINWIMLVWLTHSRVVMVKDGTNYIGHLFGWLC